MATLMLPTPVHELPPDEPIIETRVASLLKSVHIPPYGQRQGFVPRNIRDFGDGGAFPEIHIAQYPLDMGKSKNSGTIVAMQTDAEGDIDFTSILKQGTDRHVWGKPTDLVAYKATEEELSRPEDMVQETTEQTRAALESIVESKLKATALAAKGGDGKSEPTYIRYTPANSSASHNSGARQRVIRLVEKQADPLEPAKFKAKRVPRGPPSPPPPVLHSPPRKLTAEEKEEWKIPQCISNWKNKQGFTIALDKRLAADGRGLQQPQINDKFAKLAESLYIAERKVREEVALRSQVRERAVKQKREEKETQLRMLADEARKERSMVLEGKAPELVAEDETEEIGTAEERLEREKLREERKREIARERRMEAMNPSKKKKTLEERDISERVALGVAAPTTSESMFDQRLFNQTEGVDAGFGSEDSYNIYNKPLFYGGTSAQLYKHKQSDEYGKEDMDKMLNTRRFQPDRGFSGTEGGEQAARTGPVEYEKETDDPFGFDSFLDKPKETRRLDHIGKQGSLHAGAAGGAGGETADRLRQADGSRRLNFESKGKQ